MRKIKFRAWDKDKKIFLPQDSFAVLTDHYAGALFVMVKDFENYREGEFGYQNNFELMQYTGLKDKNGVEIFEGDIVIIGSLEDFPFGAVEYDTEWGRYYIRNNSKYQFGGEHVCAFTVDRFEVLGNVYENPELLNNKDN